MATNPSPIITWPVINNSDKVWEVGDVVYFRDLNADALTVQNGKEKPFRVYPTYRGVVVYVNNMAHWCTVQYGRNFRTTVYFNQLMSTEDFAHKTVIVDTNLPAETVDRITKTATSMGVWVCPMDLRAVQAGNLDDAIQSVYGTVTRQGNSREYTYAVALAAAGFSRDFPEASIFDIRSLNDGTISEETIRRCLDILEPLKMSRISSLFVRAYARI